ncbi:mitochondrial processing peptidase alpha subunit, putative [Plasmodium chabaudi chabaudi]|uniref:Mitochondrial processing peptidase alpha subunit, putative n=2 Tax=Plasmodium chabaudi TaxID=5825 RepID=A0A1C6YPK8_PLACU|nr:mitochondrial processing peptidase alpha subunit, putative [Plasmodium chabaudi adami]SCM25352.1 mitochondrial processing peptidase alpha subunit, putative [Plasmodium chabaudi chabaudi]SCN62404.1 mitochondrial processing peptidase alpha subunit, putative [Plasmodium chabaudi adami]SCN62415.1 mitochondrial processing peptidase alpha subunit, putative [Plasmodium chabaudi chabaudi]
MNTNIQKLKLVLNKTKFGKKSYSHDASKLKRNPNLEKLYTGDKHDFSKVIFKKEQIEDVIKEVKFDYYYFNEGKKNKYKDIPLNVSIIKESDLPPYKPVDDKLNFSILENDLKIISTNKNSGVCSIGLYIKCGSRYEEISDKINEQGMSVMIENMAFHSTAHLSHLRAIKSLEKIGANVSCNAFREHIVYTCECLNEYLPVVINLLIGNVLFPRFLSWEMKNNVNRLNTMRAKLFENNEMYITELLHNTAWYNNTLGNKLYVSESNIENYTSENLRNFMLKHFSPKNMTLVGVNVDHNELTKWTSRAFQDYVPIPYVKQNEVTPNYTGGFVSVEDKNIKKTNIAIAYETKGGWKTSDMITLTVLQTLMGGGGSFSTGGPGKGMYSRLFLNVLNNYNFIESCMAFSTQHSDTGLFGLYFTGDPANTKDIINSMALEFHKMNKCTDEELNRAKKSLKSFMWMSLEYKSILMEDIARQMMILNRILSGKQLCDAIDAVTKEDINRVVSQFLKTKPTVVVYGNISHSPHYDEICKMLG